MENIKEKCSFIEHKEINAINYCQECKVYMCNKCSNYHQGLLQNHHQYSLEKKIKEIFNNICKEIDHPNELEYFCKNHNKLCCASCIVKLKGKGKGQHKDCNICFIENIKEEKKNKLTENIKFLEDISNNLEDLIKELKIISQKINENKEKLKLKIQNIFTKLRNILNQKEDELLLEADNQYKDINSCEDIIKGSEKLPNKIKLSLEKGKLINNNWNDNNQLSSLISDCINIEENIKKIELINSNIKRYKLNNDIKIEFFPGDQQVDFFIKNFKSFFKPFSILRYPFLAKVANASSGRVNLRTGPSLNNDVILVINAGEIVSVKSFENNWYKLTYENQTGYMMAEYIEKI